MVICGNWNCSAGGEWKFEIDKGKMSRVVPIHEGIDLEGVHRVIAEEFAVTVEKPSLSYWSPDSLMFSTGCRTPPVMVTSDVGFQFYLKAFRRNRGLNLFVKFVDSKRRSLEDVGSEETSGDGKCSVQCCKKGFAVGVGIHLAIKRLL